ncbi:MAG TPA: hypothetical protein VGS09_02385 [Actinomycetota bacterium]|nr:hypothetical protein [Actinomycetota bacterium]
MTGPPVAVRTVFERFPASVRGAVAVRGADPDPHQVALSGAAVVELGAPTRPVRDVSVQQAVVDIAPRREVLIPFEIPLAGLEPGWYGVMAEVVVDGVETVKGPWEHARRFLVPWPRGEVRRGTVTADLRIEVPGSKGAEVNRVECKGDRTVVRWRHEPVEVGEPPEFEELTVLADGRRLPVLESGLEPSAGGRTTVVYPVLARQRTLTFQLGRRNRAGQAPERGPWSAELSLP